MIWRTHPVFSSGGVDGGGGSPPPGSPPPGTGDAPPKREEGTGDAKPFSRGSDAPDALTGDLKDATITAPTDFPEDWRVKMAGEDKDTLKKLERYKSPVDVAKALRAAEQRISKGLTDEPMPDPEKEPEAAKTWRKERGIPEDPTGYVLPPEVTKRLYDEDKPVLANFTEFAHKKNLPPSAVAVAAEWYVEQQDAAHAKRNELDKQEQTETQDEMYATFGKDATAAKNVAERVAHEILGEQWFKARLPDDPKYGKNAGRMLSNIPELTKGLYEMGIRAYGDQAFIGGDSEAKTMGRLEEIEQIRDQDFAKYDGDLKMQAEYQSLLESAIKSGKRKAR